MDHKQRQSVKTSNPDQTRALGCRLGEAAIPGTVFAISGPLGAGKTTLAQGILQGLGVTARVTSPSFILAREYQGRLPAYHWDAYRLEGPDDLYHLPFFEQVDGDGVVVIEWADRVEEALPHDSVFIQISRPVGGCPGVRLFCFGGEGPAATKVMGVVDGECTGH